MKNPIIYLFAGLIIIAASCKGPSTNKNTDSSSADSGQTHVGNESPADTNKLPATPVETGGKDTSGNGSGTTNAPKDTLKKNFWYSAPGSNKRLIWNNNVVLSVVCAVIYTLFFG